MAKVSPSTINQLERGVILEPSYSLVTDLARELGVEPDSLFLANDTAMTVEHGDQRAA